MDILLIMKGGNPDRFYMDVWHRGEGLMGLKVGLMMEKVFIMVGVGV